MSGFAKIGLFSIVSNKNLSQSFAVTHNHFDKYVPYSSAIQQPDIGFAFF